MKLKYILGLSAIAFAGCVLSSCNDDDNYDFVGNPNNLVYVNIAREYPASMPKNSFAYTVYSTPVGPVVGSVPTDMIYTVKSTKNAPTDIKVNLAVDPTMTVEGYKSFPEGHGLVVTLEESFVTIPQGTNTSNAIAVTIDDTNANWNLFSEGTYLLPIRITSVEGATGSQEIPAAYVGVDVQVKTGMVNPSASASGTQIADTDGWVFSWEAPDANRSGQTTNLGNLLDGSQWSYAYFVANHADGVNEELINTMDMGKVRTISGIFLQYYYNWYTVKDVTVYTSTDGVNFTDQGKVEYGSNTVQRSIGFWAPFEARYVRVVTHSFYGGTGEGTAFADFIIYE